MYKALDAGPSIPFLFFIDGLDEYEGEHSRIAQFVDRFSRRLPHNLRLCICSRPEADFVFQFVEYPVLKVEQHSSADVQLYVSERMKEAEPLLGEATNLIARKIIEKARGVFLWVKLVIDSLQRGWRRYESLDRLERRLHNMPPDLADVYQRIIKDMDPEEMEEACLLLAITVFAQRPLLVRELYHAFIHSNTATPSALQNHFVHATLSSEAHHHYSELELLEKRIPILTRSLLQVGNNNNVYVLHETVQTFFYQRMVSSTYPAVSLPAYQGNLLLLSACINYLTSLFGSNQFVWSLKMKEIQSWSEEQTDIYELGNVYLNGTDWIKWHEKRKWSSLTTYPMELGFLHYATEHWLRHAVEAELETQSGNCQVLDRFKGLPFDLWRRLYQVHNPYHGRRMPVTMLALALETGLNRYALSEIEAIGNYTRLQSSVSNLPLHYLLFAAAKLGNIDIVDRLLAKGIPLVPDDDYWMRLLDLASYDPASHSKDSILRPQLGSLRHWGQACLCRAVHFDHANLVQYLINHGVKVSMLLPILPTPQWLETGGLYRTQVISSDRLSSSLRRSRVSISRGHTYSASDTNTSSEVSSSTSRFLEISEAARSYDLQTDGAQAFLDSVLSVQYHVLDHAIERRSHNVVVALMDFVDTRISRSELSSALILACQRGESRSVKALIDRGADAAWSRLGQNCLLKNAVPCYALTYATHAANFEDVALLLQAGADPNIHLLNSACNPPHGSPLGVAIQSLAKSPDNLSRQAVVTKLLQHGGELRMNMCDDSSWAELLPFLSDNLETPSVHTDLLAIIRSKVNSQGITKRVRRQFSFEYST